MVWLLKEEHSHSPCSPVSQTQQNTPFIFSLYSFIDHFQSLFADWPHCQLLCLWKLNIVLLLPSPYCSFICTTFCLQCFGGPMHGPWLQVLMGSQLSYQMDLFVCHNISPSPAGQFAITSVLVAGIQED